MAASAEDLVSMVLFARVVEERSFTAAAARLGLSKSAVSAQVARFEARLGTRLLHRTTRRLSLTDAGLQLYQRCTRIAAEADEAAALAQGLGREPRGPLRVNAPSVLGARFVAPAMGEFLRRHPEVSVQLSLEDRFVDVTHGGFDVVLRVARKGQLGEAGDVTARRLATDRLLVCAAPSYLEARGRPAGPEDLLQHHCLRYLQNTPHQEWRFERDGEAAYLPVPSAFATNNGQALYDAALAGLGLAVMPAFMAAPALASGALQEVLPAFSRTELGIWALYPGRRHTPARVRVFVDFLAAHFRQGLDAQVRPGSGA